MQQPRQERFNIGVLLGGYDAIGWHKPTVFFDCCFGRAFFFRPPTKLWKIIGEKRVEFAVAIKQTNEFAAFETSRLKEASIATQRMGVGPVRPAIYGDGIEIGQEARQKRGSFKYGMVIRPAGEVFVVETVLNANEEASVISLSSRMVKEFPLTMKFSGTGAPGLYYQTPYIL